MRLSRRVREEFRRQGRRGGRLRARRLSPSARASIARQAALRRWIRARFGRPSFAALALPGGDLIDRGLDDAAAGRESVESLLVSLAAPRLRREGIPLPAALPENPEWRLFRRLEAANSGLAHARYLALLRQAASFADACRPDRRRSRARA
jgi:hypothetical protein